MASSKCIIPCACPVTSLQNNFFISVEAAVSDFNILTYKFFNLVEDIYASFQSHVIHNVTCLKLYSGTHWHCLTMYVCTIGFQTSLL